MYRYVITGALRLVYRGIARFLRGRKGDITSRSIIVKSASIVTLCALTA